jgi:hypothetical protein
MCRSKTVTIAFVCFFLFHLRAATAGIKTYTGLGDPFWQDFSAVYAYVVSTTETGPAHLRVRLEIFATFAGAYDAAQKPMLESDLYYGTSGALNKPPAVPSRVVAIVQRLRDVNGRLLDRYVIPSAFMTFMPNEAAILEVNGFDDPKVQEVISRLRRLRAPSKDAAKK